MLSIAKSLQLRPAHSSPVGLAVAGLEDDPDPVSLFLLARLLKLPERLVWKPRRVFRLEDSTDSEGTDNRRLFKELTCFSVTSSIEETWSIHA